jgi:hypothetical protein
MGLKANFSALTSLNLPKYSDSKARQEEELG